jgi:hypothetical protein
MAYLKQVLTLCYNHARLLSLARDTGERRRNVEFKVCSCGKHGAFYKEGVLISPPIISKKGGRKFLAEERGEYDPFRGLENSPLPEDDPSVRVVVVTVTLERVRPRWWPWGVN